MIRFESPSRRTPLLVSQQIDHVLLTAMREEISHEMQVKSLAAKNSAKNDYQWANAELSVVDEWAEKLFAAWIEIWDTQGLPRCHALYRAIFDCELVTLFATRNGCFKGQLQRRAMVNRSRNDSAIGGWFSREIDKLASKWNRRMAVESRKSMYAAKREQTAVTVQKTVTRPMDALYRAFEDSQYESYRHLFSGKPTTTPAVQESEQNPVDRGAMRPNDTVNKRSRREGQPTKESLLAQIQNAPDGECFKTVLAALALGVHVRTIARRVRDGKLAAGPKRGTITARSLRRLLNIKRPTSPSQRRTRT